MTLRERLIRFVWGKEKVTPQRSSLRVRYIDTQNHHGGDGSKEHPFRVSEKLAHGPLDNVWTPKLWARQQVADDLVACFRGFGGCGRCEFPWAIVDGHTTHYTDHSGMFPLCEQCWRELQTAENRMPYYRALFDRWGSVSSEKWGDIESAVLREGFTEGRELLVYHAPPSGQKDAQ